jgi:very-short-patch-repair endonuclease
MPLPQVRLRASRCRRTGEATEILSHSLNQGVRTCVCTRMSGACRVRRQESWRDPASAPTRRGAGLARARTGRATLLACRRGALVTRVTPAARGIAAPGAPPGREVHMVARAELLRAHAGRMRRAPTPSEERLWRRLRGSQLGVVFRRQVVVGGYIVDFAASSVRIVVEVDGGYHAERAEADAKRDARLARAGWRVVRLASDEPVEVGVVPIDAARPGQARARGACVGHIGGCAGERRATCARASRRGCRSNRARRRAASSGLVPLGSGRSAWAAPALARPEASRSQSHDRNEVAEPGQTHKPCRRGLLTCAGRGSRGGASIVGRRPSDVPWAPGEPRRRAQPTCFHTRRRTGSSSLPRDETSARPPRTPPSA